MASQTTLLGAAGEHYVMAQLLRRNYIAALAPAGVPNADIVVTDLDGQRLSAVQVKSKRAIGSDGGWHMSAKHEKIISDHLFYCFVNFGKQETDVPQSFIIPSTVVAETLRRSHVQWLANPGQKGQPHKEHDMRRLMPDYARVFTSGENPYPEGWMDKYRDAWELLGSPQSNASDL